MKFKKLISILLTTVLFLSYGVGAYAEEISPSDVTTEDITEITGDYSALQLTDEKDSDYPAEDSIFEERTGVLEGLSVPTSVKVVLPTRKSSAFSDELIDLVADRIFDLSGDYVDVSKYGLTTDQATIKALLNSVQNKYPLEYDIAYISSWGYSYSGTKLYKLRFTYKFPQTVGEFNAKLSALRSKCSEICGSLEGKTNLEKIVAVHNYLIENSYYQNISDGDCRTGYNILINHFGVCQAYTNAFGILMNLMSIPCIAVVSDPMNHTWNMVNYDGNWYHVDVTWDDPVISNQELTARSGYERYDNLLQNDEGIQALEHYDWVTDIESNSTAFVDMPRNRIYQQFVNNDRWFLYSGSQLISTDIYGHNSTVIANDATGGVAFYDNVVYYGSNKQIKRYLPATGESDAPYTMPAEESAGLPSSLPVKIVALNISDGVLGYTYQSWQSTGNGYYSSFNVESDVKINLKKAGFIKSVSLDKTSAVLGLNKTLTLRVTADPAASTEGVVWNSSDESVATVSEGVVIGKGLGNAVITATIGFFKAECEVEVAEVNATAITLDKMSLTLNAGELSSLTATVTPPDCTESVTWTSSDENVVTVAPDGTVSAVGTGTAVISVQTSWSGLTAQCTVTVISPLTALLNVDSQKVRIGESIILTANHAGGLGDVVCRFYYQYNGVMGEITGFSENNTVEWTPEEAGAYTLYAEVKDANGTLATDTTAVTVLPECSLSASLPSPQKQNTLLTLTATGGNQYAFGYEYNNATITLQELSGTSECSWTPDQTGIYMLYVDIYDADGFVVRKTLEYTVTDLHTFTLDKEGEQNVGVNLTLTAEGGASYKFYYEYNGAWCSITSNTSGVCEWSPKYAGNYLLYVDIKDASGKVIACRTQAFKLNDPFSLTCDKESTELPYGTTINFTADGGTSYKFYYEKQGEWVRVQNFSASNTCAWTPTAAGKYNFYCDIKVASGKVVSCKRMTFNITNPYSFTADKTGNQPVGTAITFTATGGHQYKFYYEKDGAWARIQSFSTANTCTWTPTVAGRYNVYCDIADENGRVLVYKGMEYVIGDAGTSNFTFTTSLDSPQPMNTEITLTATGGASYKFYYEVGGKWATVKNFSSANTCTWKPDMITDYTLYVDIKNSNGKVVKTLSKKFTATDPYSFTVNATSPQNIGKSVTFTAAGGASYKFYYQYAGAWVKIQDSTSATCNWRPNKAGEYMVYVDIKDASGKVLTCRTMKLVFTDPFQFTTTAGSLTQPAGTAIVLNADGGTSYKFYYEKNGAWVRIQNFSTANTCTWTPTEAGTYNVYCDIKDASGSVAVCKRISFTITD